MQKLTRVLLTTSAAVIFVVASIGSVSATPIPCNADPNINYMEIDNSEVSACLLSGTGNLTGNPANDLFLINSAGAGFELASKSDEANPFNIMWSQDNGTGEWSFDASFWNIYSSGALAFKFGTGNQEDEWFVFSLVNGVSSGYWEFINIFELGGGLSHVNLYGVRVPEPSTLGLLGIGLVLIGLRRRRRV